MYTNRQDNGDYHIENHRVEMFGVLADTCTCAVFQLEHKHCDHMAAAEEAEKKRVTPPEPPFWRSPLTSNADFSLLK